ncbi:hypothetical protein D3218_19130 [Aureimonas flava]|uniref:Uncharacterized protein n=1 Tax=Aureimonas flava TaxID=2320271 RepID=A0A3A1WE85_9HYPH|nr:hypothetical protein [Aureimonas flava]RIX97175.1 hypothetical protein D3218_19130 [Aureimonas flava]
MLTRREALSTLTKGAAAGALTAGAIGAAHAASSDILRLIQAHRLAKEAFADAVAALDEAEMVFDRDYDANPIRLKGHLVGCIDPAYETRTSLTKYHERERAVFVGERVQHLYPAAHKLISDRIDQMEEEDLALFDTARQMLAERRAAAGLDTLERQHEAAERAEYEAYRAFAAFAPQTMADVASKAAYALELVEAGGDAHVCLDALVDSLVNGRAA